MRSAAVVTHEIDDLEVAVNELVAGIHEKLVFERATIGIVHCDADVDVGELGGRLHEELGCDIVGLTTTASMERQNGYCDMGIVLAVITGDDVDIVAESIGVLSKDNHVEQIRNAYSDARRKLPRNPELILICSPYIKDLTSDSYMETLDEISGHVPVFGGVATDHYDLQYSKTFRNGEAFAEGLVFVLISGNIKPVFAMKHRFGSRVERKSIITKSTANLVERVGNKTFKEYLSEITLVPDDDTVVYHFQSTPFIMELPDHEASEQPVVRMLCSMDHETGAGGFISRMPEGSKLSINVLQCEDLAASCVDTLDDLIGKMKQTRDYEYSMVLISTCNGRHLLMGSTKDLETNILIKKLSGFGPELNAIGFYGFGEMCPTVTDSDRQIKNRFHNMSFAACAF